MLKNIFERGNRGRWKTLRLVRCRERIRERMALQLETDLQNVERGDTKTVDISYVASVSKKMCIYRDTRPAVLPASTTCALEPCA